MDQFEQNKLFVYFLYYGWVKYYLNDLNEYNQIQKDFLVSYIMFNIGKQIYETKANDLILSGPDLD